MVQSQLSRLLKYSVRFSRFYAELTVNCTKVTLTFAEQSLYAGRSLRIGFGAVQLPLPLFRNIQFCHF